MIINWWRSFRARRVAAWEARQRYEDQPYS